MSTAQSLIASIDTVRYNPAGMQRLIWKNLAALSNGDREVCDATNPFAFGIDAACCLTAAFMIENQVNNRAQYPYAAQTWDDLYRHMSDKDYIDRFSQPSHTTMSLLLSKQEVLDRAVPTDNPNIRKLVIPRNTYFTVAEVNFSMQYPIELRVMSHGGLQIVYDVDIVSPLEDLVSNVVPVAEVSNAGLVWLKIDIDVAQFDIITRKGTLNQATGFQATIDIADQYYYTRVYVEDNNGAWQEIRTTHSDQIYDATVPTAVLRVVGQTVTVEIPQVYTTTLLLNRGIRIDVYQTKGPMNMILDNYDFPRFKGTMLALDESEDNAFVAPLKTFHNIAVFSQAVVSGGRNELTFEDMRDRVIKNATGSVTIPITNVQIETTLVNAGYSVVKNIDDITNRVFLATRALPEPTTGETVSTDTKNVVTGAAISIETLSLSFDSISELSSVIDNGDRITITPDTLYKDVGGVVKFLSDTELAQIQSLPVDSRALAVTNGNYLYTPFHYVLDTTSEEFDSRPYYLDGPKVLTKSFVSENDTTLLQVSTGSYELKRSANGYTLRVIAASNDAYKALSDDQVHVELAFIPPGERDYAYLIGTHAGFDENNERVFDFPIDTRFDVNGSDQLVLNSFLLYSEESHKTPTDLTSDFVILWSSSAVMPDGYVKSSIDDILGTFELPARIAGITHEKLSIKFGEALDTLWARSRSVISSVPYMTYTVDVPWTYAEDVYQKNLDGSIVTIVDGLPVYTKLHSKGDIVYEDDGVTPSYRYRVGDPILDNDGNPVPASTRGMTRQLDMLFIEGAYWFATEGSTVSYRNMITKLLVGWLVEDLEGVQSTLLEQTRLYFYPKSTMGGIDVMILDGLVTTIEAGQSFTLTLSVSEAVDKNDALKAKLERTAIQTLAAGLKDEMVAHSVLVDNLQDILGSDIKGLTLSMLGDSQNISVATVMDPATRLGIRKRLAALPDDTLTVQDDVTIQWIRHQVKS